jgi:t-SNARE complex subunit (syntaxin)
MTNDLAKKEWTTTDSRNTPSAINLEEEEIVDAPGNDGNASMPEQVKRPNSWRKIIIYIIIIIIIIRIFK